jgi:hypothetical protein
MHGPARHHDQSLVGFEMNQSHVDVAKPPACGASLRCLTSTQSHLSCITVGPEPRMLGTPARLWVLPCGPGGE